MDENDKKNKEVTDETVDEKRIRMAKMILSKAKKVKDQAMELEDKVDYLSDAYEYS